MQFEANEPSASKPDVITPKELIKRHIADPTHKVTDEELKKLVVGTQQIDRAQPDTRVTSFQQSR
jgi:hypothetical protein